jgi:hypothetical protein
MKKVAIIIAAAVAIGAVVALFWPVDVDMVRPPTMQRTCISHLRTIDSAKTQWALENNKGADAVPTMADLARYMKDIPTCPAGGVYTVGSLNELPRCSVKGHQIDAK